MADALAPATVRALRLALCRWFHRHRRDLPWRRTRDPYAIWISEAMLQQTRVEAVLDHYRRFLARFPDVRALAAASVEEVEEAWSGLGYYRRARALREAARVIVAEHAGLLPADRDALLALPGVGRYTAGAVLSIAHGRSEPLVDGNVARVFSRLFLLDAPLGTSAADRALWGIAAELVPPAAARGVVHPSHWNQGLMELGATVCLPEKPHCSRCPVAEHCGALRTDRVHLLPVRKPRRASVDVALEIAVVRRGGDVLVRRRPESGRMAGLWELPTRELAPAGHPPRLWGRRWGIAGLRGGVELARISHSITHHRIRAVVRTGALPRTATLDGPCRWVGTDEARRLALTGLARKALTRISSA